MIKKILTLYVTLLFFSSCQKNLSKKGVCDVEQYHDARALQESVARMLDIPDVPLPVVIKNITYASPESDQLQICCDMAGMNKVELYAYYEGEMERLGWSLQGAYDGLEGMLVFVKPGGSLCVISIRDHKCMVITVIKKKDLL